MKTLLTWEMAYRLICINGYEINPKNHIEYEDDTLKDLIKCLENINRQRNILFNSLRYNFAKTKVKLISTIRRNNTQFIGTVEAETQVDAITLLCARFHFKTLHLDQDAKNFHEPYLRKLEPTIDKNVWDFHIVADNYE